MNGTIRVSADIPRATKAVLKAQAVKEGLMFSALLKRIIEEAAHPKRKGAA